MSKIKFNVMLAHPYGKKDFDKDSFIQPKLDGIRCYITKDGAFSRNHKEFKTVEHIKKALKPLLKLFPHLILDGELYNHQFKDNFNKIVSLVRKQKPSKEDLKKAVKYIQFHWYDYVLTGFKDDFNKIISLVRKKNPNDKETEDAEKYIQFHWYDYCNTNYKSGEGLGYKGRNIVIKDAIEKLKSRHIVEVPTHEVSTIESARLWHKDFLDNGYEGSIIRTNKPYEQKRSYNLQKFKDFHDSEARITGWVEGQGKRTGTIGKFLAIDNNGINFGMPVMEDYKIMEKMYDIADWYIGKVATFTYFQKTPAGSYRHPLFKCIRNYE